MSTTIISSFFDFILLLSKMNHFYKSYIEKCYAIEYAIENLLNFFASISIFISSIDHVRKPILKYLLSLLALSWKMMTLYFVIAFDFFSFQKFEFLIFSRILKHFRIDVLDAWVCTSDYIWKPLHPKDNIPLA